MMKRLAATLMMILLAAACCFAMTQTHTVVLVSRVERVDAQYVIRNAETGLVGSSVVYSTDAITKGNVRTSFDILQSNDSNSRQAVVFSVSATELVARVDGKVFSTKGVQISMDGVSHGSSVEFTRVMDRAVAAGTTVGSFNVEWQGDANLAQATYEACVTLTCTAL